MNLSLKPLPTVQKEGTVITGFSVIDHNGAEIGQNIFTAVRLSDGKAKCWSYDIVNKFAEKQYNPAKALENLYDRARSTKH